MADNTTNPQDMVDAALGSPQTLPTTPANTMETLPPPPPAAPDPVDPALLTPPTTTTTTTTTVTAPSTGMVVGDDTPLAFATKPTSGDTTVASVTSELPGAAPLPPVGGMPSASPAPSYNGMTNVVQAKPKGKAGKVLVALVGFLMLAGGVFGGYQYYVKNYGSTADVAEVGDAIEDLGRDECGGCVRGGRLVWRNGRCVHTGTCSEDGDTGGGAVDAIVTCGTAGAFQCGRTPDGCGGFCVNGVSKTCDDWLRDECNFEPVRGANYVGIPSGASCPSGFQSAKCDCGGQTVCFDRGFDGSNGTTNQCNTADGLCAVYTNSQATGGNGGRLCGTKVTYYCDKNVDLSGGKSCDTSTGGTTTRPANFCGIIQEDIACQGFKTTIIPCDTSTTTTPNPSPSPSPAAPVMACTGITRAPTTAPAIGSTLTFTCTGTITPTTAGTLSYKFRYNINNGTMTALTNKTATTAELTVAACGEYRVECQTCATIAGVLKCDPIWTGATQ